MAVRNLYQKYYDDVDYELLDHKNSFQKYSEIEMKRLFIFNGIYIQLHTPFIIKNPYPNTFWKLKYVPENKFMFGNLFFLDNKIYELNPKLLFNICNEIIDNATDYFDFNLERLKQEIDFEFSIRLPDEKLEFYKSKRIKLLEDFDAFKKDKFEWVNSLINPNLYQYDDLLVRLEYALFEFVEELNDYIFNHSIENLTVCVRYRETYNFHNLILYLNERIKGGMAISSKKENEVTYTRNNIFKDNESQKLFEYIIKNWEEEADTSFYSMLFKYLQKKNKIWQADKDSKVYRVFIMETYNLVSFKRIQEETSDKENTVWKKNFVIFNSLTEKFTQQSE